MYEGDKSSEYIKGIVKLFMNRESKALKENKADTEARFGVSF